MILSSAGFDLTSEDGAFAEVESVGLGQADVIGTSASHYDSVIGTVTNKNSAETLPIDLQGEAHTFDDLRSQALLARYRKDYPHCVVVLTHLEGQIRQHPEFDTALSLQLLARRYALESFWIQYHAQHQHTTLVERKTTFHRRLAELKALQPMEPSESQGIDVAFVTAQVVYWHRLGLLYDRNEVFDQAMACFRQALSLADHEQLETAQLLDSLAFHYERLGDTLRAMRYLERALELKTHLGVRTEAAISHEMLGRLYLDRRAYQQAENHFNQALTIAQAVYAPNRQADIQNELIHLFWMRQRHERCRELIQSNKALCEQHHLKGPLGLTMLYQAGLHYRDKDYRLCAQVLDQGVVPLLQQQHQAVGLGKAYRLKAWLAHKAQAFPLALGWMGEALSMFRQCHDMDEVAQTYLEMGRLYHRHGYADLAVESWLTALKVADSHGLLHRVSDIEDALYELDRQQWALVVNRRSRHEPLFGAEESSLDEALNNLVVGPLPHIVEADTDIPGLSARSLVALLRVGQAMAQEQDLDRLLDTICIETESALEAERCSVFLLDAETNQLWARAATGLDETGRVAFGSGDASTANIRFDAHLGIAGYVAKTGEVVNLDNAYSDPRFNPAFDRQTGYKTQSLLCVPMRNRQQEIIGVFQVLNKCNGDINKSFGLADVDLLSAIGASAAVAIENAKLHHERKIAFVSFIKTLSSTIDARDPITAGHSERVALYADLLGRQMRLTDTELEALNYASLLHDIGKIGVREEVLVKDGRLTEKEYRHIQEHAFYTHEILKNIHFEHHLKMVPEIAASHHEKIDGSGYYRGLAGDQIPFSGRILAVSDVMDAITSRRHYRDRMPFSRVLQVFRSGADGHFDAQCIEGLFNLRLYQLAEVLLQEQRHRDDLPTWQGLLSQLDKAITVVEYEKIILKPDLSDMTPGQAQVHQVFTQIYHTHPPRQSDLL